MSPLFILIAFFLITLRCYGEELPFLNPDHPNRLPASFEGKPILPDFGCFWSFSSLDDDSYKTFPDAVAPSGAFDAFYLTLRSHEKIVDNQPLLEKTRQAVEYARAQYGIGTLLDIDVRIARKEFAQQYPDLLQERLFLDEKELDFTVPNRKESSNSAPKSLEFLFQTGSLTDHYTGKYPYSIQGNRLAKAWIYQKNDQNEILPQTIRDVSQEVVFQSLNNEKCCVIVPESLRFSIKDKFDFEEHFKTFICVAAAFQLLYPDIFAEETLNLERQIYEMYRTVPAAGIGKDEWGFPPCFAREDNLNDYWFSRRMSEKYAETTNGRSLLDDFLLMFRPQQSRETERLQCFDDFHRLCLKQVLRYEIQNYYLSKEIWGSNAFIGVHGTWFPWPNICEFRKNGLFWWQMPRDYAQSDEFVPFCCRNSMAKATRSTWINMFYSSYIPPYINEHWTAALSAGRVHLHGIYPTVADSPSHPINARILPITEAGVDRIRSKIRLLNLITNSPLNSSVAVVFGHFGVMNPLREEYKKVGVELCDHLALAGYPADLIPSDEINSVDLQNRPLWFQNKDGFLQYGAQAYRYIVFYGVNDSDRNDFEALAALKTDKCQTHIVEIPVQIESSQKISVLDSIINSLKEANIPVQTPWKAEQEQFMSGTDEISTRPNRNGFALLIDGTYIRIASQNNSTGEDIILEDEPILSNSGQLFGTVSVQCNGLFACRFNENGILTALVATDLRFFSCNDLEINLIDDFENKEVPEGLDVVLLRKNEGQMIESGNAQHSWLGIFQARENNLPDSLKKITADWQFLASPFPPSR